MCRIESQSFGEELNDTTQPCTVYVQFSPGGPLDAQVRASFPLSIGGLEHVRGQIESCGALVKLGGLHQDGQGQTPQTPHFG